MSACYSMLKNSYQVAQFGLLRISFRIEFVTIASDLPYRQARTASERTQKRSQDNVSFGLKPAEDFVVICLRIAWDCSIMAGGFETV